MKNTKKSLLISILSLILCMSMLLGTTYAWFTDSVVSGVNQIKAGNLDIEVEYKNDNTNDWTPLQGSDTVFSKSLWEPGHTEFVTLKIVNKGTLALKYKAIVSPVSESGGINMAGESFKLSNYLVFGTTAASDTEPQYDNRAEARAELGTTTTMGLNQSALTRNSTMLPKEATADTYPTQYITLVVYMPETVGNEANYKTGTTAPSIDLGITVVATQLTSENDSFDDQYDKDADYDPAAAVLVYNYFPQVNVTAQLVINEQNKVAKGSEAGNNVTVTPLDGDDNTKSKVEMSSTEQIENTPAAKVETILEKDGEHQTGSMTLKVVKDDTANANFQSTNTSAIDTTKQDSTTYQVTVETEGVVAVPEEENKATFKVDLFIGKNRINVKMYHNGNPMEEAVTGVDNTFTYNDSTGYVTMYVDTFSPFTAVYDMPVAAIGTTVYYSLESAFKAATTGQTITMLKDVKLSNSIVIDKEIKFNLNGKTITDEHWGGVSPTAQAFFYVKSGAKLTVNDSAGTGEITTENEKIYGAIIMTINGDNNDSENAVLVVNGGTLRGYFYGVATNGNRHNTNITVNGGTLTGTDTNDSTSIYHPNKGKLTINGGTLIGYDGLAVKGGAPVTITGGEFIATGTKVVPTQAATSGCNSVGSALYVEGNYGYGAQVVISGGTFTTTDSTAPAVLSMFNEETASTISITGGTFSSDPTEYVADGFKAVENDDHTWTVGTALFAGGAGTKNNPYLIATDIQLAHIYNYLATNQGQYTYFKQIADIEEFKYYSNTEYYYFVGEYDGGGHKITPANSVNKAVDLFDLYYGETTIKNLDLYSSDTTPVALAYSTYYVDKLNVENVNFYAMKDSTIHINAGNFGFVTRNPINDQRVNPAHGQVFNLKNVNNYVNVENIGNCTAAYFGSGCISCLSPSKGRTENCTFIFNNCHNYGNISSALYSGVVWGNGSYNSYFGPSGDNISDEDMEAMVVFENGGLINHATISAPTAHAFADGNVASTFILNAKYQNTIGGSYVTVDKLSGTYNVYFDGSEFKVNDNGATNTYIYKVALSVGSIYHYGTDKNVSNGRKLVIVADEATSGDLFITSKIHAYDKKTAVNKGIISSSESLDYKYECDGLEVAMVVKEDTLYLIFAENSFEPDLFVDSAVSTYLYAYNQSGDCVGSIEIKQN